MFRRNSIGRLIGVAAGLCAVNRTAILNIGLADLGGHPKPAIRGHLKTGQRRRTPGH
jgi:hypothetical protein